MLAVLGALAALAPPIGGKPLMGYLSALLFVAAAALLAPLVVHAAPRLAGSSGLRRVLGVEALLASRSLGGSLRRTSVLVGALATAIAMMTSVGIMVGSFRQTVLTWMDSELPADLYLAPAGAMGGDLHPTIAPEVADRIASDARRGEREPPSRLRDSVPGLARHAGGRKPGIATHLARA